MADDNKTLDMNEFLKRHLNVRNWLNYREQTYNKTELVQLTEMVTELFRTEQTLAKMSPPCTIVGDIHGQYSDLLRLLNSRGSKLESKKLSQPGFCANRFVFLGDYVDRGSHSIECISLVFALKIVYPGNYVLLRGNHETRAINFAYGFREELMNKLGEADGADVWEKFNEAFSWMPLACIVGERILCMHGGISPELHSLDDIRKIKRPLVDVGTIHLAQDLLWADPAPDQTMIVVHDEPVYNKNTVRGLSCVFNAAAVRDTCKRLNIQMIVRAHQMMPEGFRFYCDRKLITIFSAPRYMNETDNKGAVLKVEESGKFGVIVMNSKKTPTGNMNDELTRADDIPSQGTDKKKSDSTSKTAQSTSSKSASGSKND
uniref:Serine/threonine-protein phosphatase n=2 Tax=Caenorhabditis tropicalis TaxID=1561998 RepID=A0A1I7UXP5_9PELO